MATPFGFGRRFASALLFGAVSGAVFLGAGGRLVMRLFALATARPPAFTVLGSLNVLVAGAIAGATGGLVLLVLQRFLPKARLLRGAVFAAACFIVASPGFRPPQPLVFALFGCAFLAYGVALVAAWERFVQGRSLSAMR